MWDRTAASLVPLGNDVEHAFVEVEPLEPVAFATEAPVVLSVRNVCKSFRSYRSVLHRLAHWFALPVKPAECVDVLKDISFDVRKGQAIAFIGQNGAGKSTLLKIITGTTTPTTGTVQVGQSISAILELGLGFNMEFTGRENVRQSGGMLGLSPQQLDALMPEIEAFAEIGDYFDRPMRTHSSGMQARVAFALATAVRPEILIVDEILSVGDAYFQHKSFAKIREFRESGTTIILVSHAMSDIREICDRVFLIDKGRILRDGPPDEVIDYYNALIAAKEIAALSVEQRRAKDGWLFTRSGTFEITMTDIRLTDAASGEPLRIVATWQRVSVAARLTAKAPAVRLVVGVMIRDRTGHSVWGSNTWHTKQVEEHIIEGDEIDFSITFDCDLGPGSYSVSLALTNSDHHLEKNFEWIDNALVFDVMNVDRPLFIGTSALNAAFSLQRLDPQSERARVAMTVSCRDADPIEKHPEAGRIIEQNDRSIQIMHNGLKVELGGYHGRWMAEIISQLKGHHEPQEELLFNAVLKAVRPDGLFVELGAFWSYYSMWFLKEFPAGRALCIEPDPVHVEIGKRNMALNGLSDRALFHQAWIGESEEAEVEHLGESSRQPLRLPQISMFGISLLAGGPIEILHCDAQGAETGLLRSMAAIGDDLQVRFVFISTHHHYISGSRETHADCLTLLREMGFVILADYDVGESFSGDGLIVASRDPADLNLSLPTVSRNTPECSLFRGQ